MSKRAGVAPLRLAPGKGSSHKARFRALDSYGTEKGPEVAQATGVTGAGEGGEVMPHKVTGYRYSMDSSSCKVDFRVALY